MRLLAASSKMAFMATQIARRFPTVPTNSLAALSTNPMQPAAFLSSSRLFSSNGGDEIRMQHVGKAKMEDIVDDYESEGRADSGYVVLDVREENEIEFTGKLSKNTYTMPLQKIMALNAFDLDEADFQIVFGFEKPTPDETLVFSCAAGIRSVHAANFAKQCGYTKLVNYAGGAHEWFAPN